jgi:hypothetical protein
MRVRRYEDFDWPVRVRILLEGKMLRSWRFLAILLAALGLSFGAAHVLELGPKMEYDPQLYMAVTSTLYRYFGLVGGVVQLAAILVAAALTSKLRGRESFGPSLAGALALVVSLVLWAALVAPVNAEWARALASGSAAATEAYATLRERWEYGHVAAFLAWLVGFALLLLGVVRDTAGEERRAQTTA